MTVQKLIYLLKKMPQHLDVGYSAHDNSEHEVGGNISSVILLVKKEIDPDGIAGADSRDMYDSLPARIVVLRG